MLMTVVLCMSAIPYDVDSDVSLGYAPTSPASCLLDKAGDPESPSRWKYAGDGPDVVEHSISSLHATHREMLASLLQNVDVTGVFGPIRVIKLAANFGLAPVSSLDLTSRWASELEIHRSKAWKLIGETHSHIITGAPPCAMLCNLQQFNLHVHKHDPRFLENFENDEKQAIARNDFCMDLYIEFQMRSGRRFHHEHAGGASSWKLDSVVDTLNDGRVWGAQTDVCIFGMTFHIREKRGEHIL